MNNQPTDQEICCQPFEPLNWDDKVFEWEGKKFIKDTVFTFIYMPIGFGKVMKRLDQKVRDAEATMPDWLCLSDHTSSWNMNVYLSVDKEIPNAVNIELSGKFFSKVFEGPYKDSGKWYKEFLAMTVQKGMIIKKQYTWYTTCPKCAKKYGKNYVVIVGEIE